jgi:hypothetical protein
MGAFVALDGSSNGKKMQTSVPLLPASVLLVI